MPKQTIKQETKDKKIKISLKDMPKKHKKSGIKKEIPKPQRIAPPMPKGSQLKKIVKKVPTKTKVIKEKVNKPQKIKQQILAPKKQYVEKNIKKEIIVKKEIPNPLYAMLLEDKSNEKIEQKKSKGSYANSINSNIKELYGEKFGKLSQAQQEYILDNQEIMRRITQEVLTRQAQVADLSKININKNNVIEFYLHPNGDMSDFRFLKKTGYFILDDVTRATIEYSYSKYPRPKEKTLIRYNVFYKLSN